MHRDLAKRDGANYCHRMAPGLPLPPMIPQTKSAFRPWVTFAYILSLRSRLPRPDGNGLLGPREHLKVGTGMLKTARLVGVGSGTVQRVARVESVSQPVNKRYPRAPTLPQAVRQRIAALPGSHCTVASQATFSLAASTPDQPRAAGGGDSDGLRRSHPRSHPGNSAASRSVRLCTPSLA
jgi:hypothetical protein